ncbi:MAG: ATP-binding protein [Syntrophaceae bacterium]|nr:ATP-binding protein [Syntrophaceae bacterium]
MIPRLLQSDIEKSLSIFPVVGLIGPRQCGKTTLARMIEQKWTTQVLFLDLELPGDINKLSDPELFLTNYPDSLIIIDEIQRRPDLFPVLRALIDKDRRNGRFLILGSASPVLLKQSSESLAGRIRYHELGPFFLSELRDHINDFNRLWLRGGYPLSLLSVDETASVQWRDAFIATYLERDIPQLGIRVPSMMLRRFWTMLAHLHGGIWNASAIAGSMGVSAPTVRHYLDILCDTFIVRQLLPFHANIGKRLVKSPKVYIRDSGMLHALFGIRGHEELLNHPSAGSSWEGWVIEQILSVLPEDVDPFFYRTSSGAEIDLVLVRKSMKKPVSVEVKFSSAPQLSRGFYEGFSSLGCDRGFVVYPGRDTFEIKPGITVLPLQEIEKIAGMCA